MNTKLLTTAALIAGLAISFSACNKEDVTGDDTRYNSLDLPSTPYNYNSPFASDEMIALGRVLFYDGRLSETGSVSCATCHRQEMGFSGNAELKLGFRNRLHDWNTLEIQSHNQEGWGGTGYPHTSWDGEEIDLNTTVDKPILHDLELGLDDESAMASKMKTAAYYPDLFKDAFGSEDINIQRVNEALTAFTNSIASEATQSDKRGGEAARLTIITEAKFSNPFK